MGSHLTDAERELLEVSVALYGWATHAEALEATTKAVETLIDVRVAAERERIVSGVRAWCAINEIAAPPLDWEGLGEFLVRADLEPTTGGEQ